MVVSPFGNVTGISTYGGIPDLFYGVFTEWGIAYALIVGLQCCLR